MRHKTPAPEIENGTPATYRIGSDRYGGEIHNVDHLRPWIVFKGKNSPEHVFKWRPYKAEWVEVMGSGKLIIGIAETYLDPSF